MAPPKPILGNEYYGKFAPGERVLAAMTSFPPWPAFIADYVYLSKDVLKDRKYEDQIPVLFVPEFNYSWVKEGHIEVFTDEMLKNGPSSSVSKKSKKNKLAPQLNASYKYFRENPGITYTDFLEIYGVEKISQSEDEEKTKKQTKKTASKKEMKLGPKKRGASVTSRANDEQYSTNSSENIDEDPQQDQKQQKKVKLESDVTKDVQLETCWKFRYHLQKGLLQRKSEPDENDILTALKELEKLKIFGQNGGITTRVLGITKLHKVLKEILKKSKFSTLHGICKELLGNWSDILDTIKKEKQADPIQHNTSRDLSDVSDIKHSPKSIKAE